MIKGQVSINPLRTCSWTSRRVRKRPHGCCCWVTFDSSLTLWEDLDHVWVWKTLAIHVTALDLKSPQTALWVSTNLDGNSECFGNAVNETIPACPIISGKISCPFGCKLAKIRQPCGINYQRHSQWGETRTAWTGFTKVYNKAFICPLTLEGPTFALIDMQKNKRSDLQLSSWHVLSNLFCCLNFIIVSFWH